MEEKISELEKRRKMGLILQQAREEAGVTQEELAVRLGKARKTIQLWEYGVTSPDGTQIFDIFEVLGMNEIPWMQKYKYDIDPHEDDEISMKKEQLSQALENMTPFEVNAMHLLWCHPNGHSRPAYCSKIVADLQSPMGSCYSTALMIQANYLNAQARGEVRFPDLIQPDINILSQAIEKGRDAFINNRNEYS